MTLNVAFQMDPLENVNIEEDTTFRIAEEALIRGYNLFYYSPKNSGIAKLKTTCEFQIYFFLFFYHFLNNT